MRRLIFCAVILTCATLTAISQKKVYPQPILAEKVDIWGYAIDRDKNKLVLGYIYQEANEFDETVGQAIVKFNGHYAVIDEGGSAVIEPIYDDILFVQEYQTYIVRLHDKSGVFSCSGQQIIPVKYDNIGPGSDGWYEGEHNGEWVYVHPDGRQTSDYTQYLEWKNAPKTPDGHNP